MGPGTRALGPGAQNPLMETLGDLDLFFLYLLAGVGKEGPARRSWAGLGPWAHMGPEKLNDPIQQLSVPIQQLNVPIQ